MLPQPRYVAICDVLGFSQVVRARNLAQLADDYTGLLTETARMCRTAVHSVNANTFPANVRDFAVETGHVVFSDTLLVWSECMQPRNESDFDGSGFFTVLAVLFGVALAHNFPLRIGVAYGDTIIRPSSNIFIGNPIIDAHLTEQRQDWIGAACHPSCLVAPYAKNLRMRSAHDGRFVGPLVEYEIPVKDSAGVELRWTIDWPFWSKVSGVTRELLTSSVQRHSGSVHQPRWERALEFYLARDQIWEDIKERVSNPPAPPSNLRCN